MDFIIIDTMRIDFLFEGRENCENFFEVCDSFSFSGFFENQVTARGIKILLNLGKAGTYNMIILTHRFFEGKEPLPHSLLSID